MSRFHIIVITLLGLTLSVTGVTLMGPAFGDSDVPAEYQQLYSNLNASLDSYAAYLNSKSTVKAYQVIFGAELLPANSNRGPDLLTPQAMQGVVVYLDRLHEMGVQGVTFPVGYPLYTPSFPHYKEYVQFYKQVVQEVRKRGMKVSVESTVLFANTPFSSLEISYAGLTFDKFKTERKQMIATIIRDLQPDYLNLGAEPDTEYQLIGLKELNSPEKYTEYINYVLDGLDRVTTKIGAGIGTWGNLDYVKSLASKTNLDSMHIHVYPITGRYLENIGTISGIAKQYGKRVLLDEAWLLKVDKPTGDSVAASPGAFRRDAFSFWAPLDQKFLSIIAKSAQVENIEYISPFWTTFFFGYVDYNPSTAKLPYKELSAMANRIASNNIVSDKFTSTGEFYKQLIASSTGSTSMTTTISESTIVGGTRSPGFIVISAVAAGAIVLVTLIFLRRQPRNCSRSCRSWYRACAWGPKLGLCRCCQIC